MPKSQADVRHEAFVEAGEHAKTRADDALVDIDAILAEQDALIAGVGWMASKNWIDESEAEAAEEAIRDYTLDPLATPLTSVTDWPVVQ